VSREVWSERYLCEEAENRDGEEALMEHGDGCRPGEVPQVLGRVPSEAGSVQSCRRSGGTYTYVRCLTVIACLWKWTVSMKYRSWRLGELGLIPSDPLPCLPSEKSGIRISYILKIGALWRASR
jgi:hypothetical protein